MTKTMKDLLRSAQQTAEHAQSHAASITAAERDSMRQVRARIEWRAAVLESEISDSARKRVA